MRERPPAWLEEYRVRESYLGSDASHGNNGAFVIAERQAILGEKLYVIAAQGEGWEHVSVHVEGRCPTWTEMCWVKDLFWGDEECVVEYHPAKADYVNVHKTTLHLWKPTGQAVPLPPKEFV